MQDKTNVTIQKGSRWYEWLTYGEIICNTYSIAYFSFIVDNSILDAEGNAYGIISTHRIEITFDNDHIRLLHDIPKRYIYRYLISKLISSEATIQNTIAPEWFQ